MLYMSAAAMAGCLRWQIQVFFFVFLKQLLFSFLNNKLSCNPQLLLLNFLLCSCDSGRETMLQCCQGFHKEPEEDESRNLSEAGLALEHLCHYGIQLHWRYVSSTWSQTSVFPQSSSGPFMTPWAFSARWEPFMTLYEPRLLVTRRSFAVRWSEGPGTSALSRSQLIFTKLSGQWCGRIRRWKWL